MNNKPCPICGKNLIEETWKAKSGKMCHAFRHEDKNPDCVDVETSKPYIEWIPDTPKPSYAPKRGGLTPKIAPKGEDYQNLLAAMRDLYRLIQAATITIGGWNAKPPEMVEKWIEENITYLKNKK